MKKLSVCIILGILFSFEVFAQARKDALVLYNNGKYAESVAVCEEELKEDPNRISSYVVMCWALVRNKQYSQAEQRAQDGQIGRAHV